jgi:hypothetical protein
MNSSMLWLHQSARPVSAPPGMLSVCQYHSTTAPPRHAQLLFLSSTVKPVVLC